MFDLVGGQPFFDALVESFYERVERDPRLRRLYPEDLAPGQACARPVPRAVLGRTVRRTATRRVIRVCACATRRSRSVRPSATRGWPRCSPRSTSTGARGRQGGDARVLRDGGDRHDQRRARQWAREQAAAEGEDGPAPASRRRRRSPAVRRARGPRRAPVAGPDRCRRRSRGPPYAPDAPALVPAVPPDEIPDRMRAAGRAAREVLLEVGAAVRPASPPTSSTASATRRTSRAAAIRAPLHYKGYPKSLCTSVNEVICHGIPDDRALHDGDIVNCDVTIYLHGVHGDCNATFLVGDVDDVGRAPRAGHVRVRCGRASTRCARVAASTTSGARSRRTPRPHGFSVVRAFVGHGVGETFHTAPSVPHFYDPHADTRDRAGHDVHDRADDQRRLVGARPHLVRRLDRADARRLALRAVRAQPARHADRRRGAHAPPRRDRAERASNARSVAACDWRARRRSSPDRPSGLGRAIAVEFAREGRGGRRDRTRPGARRRGRRRDHRRGRHARRSSRPTSATKQAAHRARRRPRPSAERAHRAREQRGRRRRARRTRRRPHHRRVGGDPARRPHRADVVRAGRDPAHAARRARRDRQHLEPAGRAREPGLRRVHRGQGGAQRAHPRDRGRLRGRRHPLQHDQPRLRAQRPARRRHHAPSAGRATRACTSRGSASPTTSRTRRCTSRAASRSSSPASTSSSTAAAASPAGSRSAERPRCTPRVRERDLDVPTSRSTRTSRSGTRHGIDTVGVSVAKLEALRLGRRARRSSPTRSARGLRVANLIGLGPFHLAEPDAAGPQQQERLVRLDRHRRGASAPSAWCSRPGPFAPLDVGGGGRRARGRARAGARDVARARGVPFAIEHTNSLRVDVGFVHTLHDAIDLARRLDTGVCMEINACWAERDARRRRSATASTASGSCR